MRIVFEIILDVFDLGDVRDSRKFVVLGNEDEIDS